MELLKGLSFEVVILVIHDVLVSRAVNVNDVDVNLTEHVDIKVTAQDIEDLNCDSPLWL